jgi:hypothetical protein
MIVSLLPNSCDFTVPYSLLKQVLQVLPRTAICFIVMKNLFINHKTLNCFYSNWEARAIKDNFFTRELNSP